MKKSKFRNICLDFDGVIAENDGSYDLNIIKPITGAKNAIERFIRDGYRIYILTARLHPDFHDVEKERDALERWLKKYELPYHELTNCKPPAIMYVDDRAVRFYTWSDILNYLT